MALSHRVLATSRASAVTQAHGRAYSAGPGVVLTVPYADAKVLEVNGWVFIALSAPTSARPAPGGGPLDAHAGLKLWDETLTTFIVFDGTDWRDVSTGAVA